MPGLGACHVLTDPNEMVKVVRHEGAYPLGAISTQWPSIHSSKELGFVIAGDPNNYGDQHDGLWGHGEEWKRLRNFLQTDMFAPAAARGFVPGILEAAELASKGAPGSCAEVNNYTARASFDVFNSVMFGEMTESADLATHTSEDNLIFYKASMEIMATLMGLMANPMQFLALKSFNLQTSLFKDLKAALKTVSTISDNKIDAFIAKSEAGELDQHQQDSYLAHAIQRQKETADSEEGVSVQEMKELCMVALTAAVDTTSSIINWVLLHLALNQDVQQTLYEEAVEAGEVTARRLSTKSAYPYLNAVIREQHRLTPSLPVSLIKENSRSELDVHGITFPKHTKFLLDSYTLQQLPEYVPNPERFDPTRWLPDAVAARKGTPAQVLDHFMYRAPFSQGRCVCVLMHAHIWACLC